MLVEGSAAGAVGCQELLGLLEGVGKVEGSWVRAQQVPVRCRKGAWGAFVEERGRVGWQVRAAGGGSGTGNGPGLGTAQGQGQGDVGLVLLGGGRSPSCGCV